MLASMPQSRTYLGDGVVLRQQDVLALQVIVHLQHASASATAYWCQPAIACKASTARAQQAACWQPGRHHVLGMQEVQAARDVQRDAAAAAPPAERVRRAAAARAALQRAEQVAALRSNPTPYKCRMLLAVARLMVSSTAMRLCYVQVGRKLLSQASEQQGASLQCLAQQCIY